MCSQMTMVAVRDIRTAMLSEVEVRSVAAIVLEVKMSSLTDKLLKYLSSWIDLFLVA